MTITTKDELELALDSRYTTHIGSKASIANALAGHFMSTWPSAGLPSTGAIPTSTASVLANGTLGGFVFMTQTAPLTSYLAEIEYTSGLQNNTLEIHDRLAHAGGLSGTLTTVQTVTSLDLLTLAGTANIDARKGDANYSDVQWWLEIFSDLGSTGATATVNVTYNDGTTGNLTGTPIGNNDRRLGRMIPLNPLVPVADTGKFIRGINSVQLSASTTTAGNFGFVATRYRGSVFAEQANERYRKTWTEIGMPNIVNNSCLFMIVLCSGTATGTTTAKLKIIYG